MSKNSTATARDTRAVDALIRRSLAGETAELLGDWPALVSELEQRAEHRATDHDGAARYLGYQDGRRWEVRVVPPSIRVKRGPGGAQPGAGRPQGTELRAVTVRLAPDELALLEQLRAPTLERSRKLSQREAIVAGLRSALGREAKA